MSRYKTSRYVITAPLKDGRELAYNGMSGALAVWEPAEAQVFQDIAQGRETTDSRTAAELFYGGYLVTPETDELELLHGQYRLHRFNRRTLVLTVAPTLACNFACDYCFQGQDKPIETMGQTVQDAVVDFVLKLSHELNHVHIAWYGGEPLLRMNVIEALSDRFMAVCDERNIQYDAMAVTNGYRLTLAVAQTLVKKRVKTVQVTLDGNQVYHDSRRFLLSGGNTFDKIIKNLKEVVTHTPLKINIRVNIDHRNSTGVFQLLDVLAAEGLANQQNFRLYFAPIEAMTVGCHSVEGACMSKSDYGQLETRIYRYAFDKGLTGLPYPPRFHGSCGAIRPSSFIVIPSGDIHKCWDTVTYPQHAIGSIFDMDKAIRSEKTMRWLSWSPFNNDACRNCKLLPNCAGACAYKFLHADDTRGEAASLPCPSWKYNIKERLLLRAEKSAAILPTDWDAEMVYTNPQELCVDKVILKPQDKEPSATTEVLEVT
ncbi:MAG: TIGR04463 family radical SAM/SPASM RiPP maturase [Thiothrix sp.]|uniref:TIGR04463 family radical SAM/SPASM RiPP maturase n=1 Tax=Thiothrix sp. TaxID=1032 RepID=UPI002624DAFF|nr:TIGR04463 family radical SAM/SPASM RiPP maturase [Thiothrix sp.]MDD5394244.1 TIGR04463 family radical SAM/SPASM RiPP maturase [Thiothrix sp.]